MCMRTPQPLPKGPAEGGALGEGLRGPYANRSGLRDRTGPSKRPRPPPYAAPPIWPPSASAELTDYKGPDDQIIVKLSDALAAQSLILCLVPGPDDHQSVVALWQAFYIENKHFYLDTLRLPNRSPTPLPNPMIS